MSEMLPHGNDPIVTLEPVFSDWKQGGRVHYWTVFLHGREWPNGQLSIGTVSPGALGFTAKLWPHMRTLGTFPSRDLASLAVVAAFTAEWLAERGIALDALQHPTGGLGITTRNAAKVPVSSNNNEPEFCNEGHDGRETCPKCVNRCRLCSFEGTDSTGDELKVHVATSHTIGEYGTLWS